ncbi:hypothetical protein AAG570_001107, partial [Ranatra chinensis]
QVIEQDRHLLRRKLAGVQAELETRVVELQADISHLQRQLLDKEAALKSLEKDKTALIVELTEQNQRLTAQIKQSGKIEEQLTAQLQGLKDQATKRKTTYHDHETSLDVLREEIFMLNDKKSELERRLGGAVTQRESLSSALDEAADRIMLLEKQLREQQMQMRVSHLELEELRSANGCLGERLEALGGSWSTGGQRSLHSEMECDDETGPQGDDLHQLKMEIVGVYDRVHAVCQSLRERLHNHSSSSLPPCVTVHQVKVGLLTSSIQELCNLVSCLMSNWGSNSNSNSLLMSTTELEIELHRAQEALDRTAKEMEEKSEELKRRSETIMDLTSKLSVREAELEGALEERDRARKDLDECSSEEMVKKAWQVRDGAVARKNATQVELARTRIEVMQANSQLMEAIQQKIELSQQLEQWQMDMQALLDEQMRRKLATPEGGAAGSSPTSDSSGKRSSRRLFGLFAR